MLPVCMNTQFSHAWAHYRHRLPVFRIATVLNAVLRLTPIEPIAAEEPRRALHSASTAT
jgi:hypothetical protein